MFRPGLGIIAVLFATLQATLATAQLRPLFLNESQYQRIGLEAVWSTQLEVDGRRSDLAAMSLQVVGLTSYEALQATVQHVFEVRYEPGRVVRFAENDLGPYGNRLGRDEAQRLAEKQMILLKAEGREPQLESKTVPSTVLYVQTTGGTLQALDAETGRTLWLRTIGKPGEPAMKPSANDTYLAVIRGSKMYLLDRTNGQLIYSRDLDHNPAFGPALSATRVFVAGLNGMLMGYPLPDEESDNRGAPAWVYQSGSRITSEPLVTDTTISWGTQNGMLFAASLDGPRMLYRHITGGAIYGRTAFVPPNQLLVASNDGVVSALEQQDGLMQWSFSTGDEIYRAPIAHREQVYIVTGRGELLSVASATGIDQWSTERIADVLAVGEHHLFARDTSSGLTAINRKTGIRRGTLPALGYERSFNNLLTDRIYLLSESGSLICLREIGALDPTIQYPLPQPPNEDDSRRRRGGRDDEPAGRASGEDVFGDDAGFDDGGFDDEAFTDDAPVDPPADDSATEDDVFDFGDDSVTDDVPADNGADEGEIDDNPFDF